MDLIQNRLFQRCRPCVGFLQTSELNVRAIAHSLNKRHCMMTFSQPHDRESGNTQSTANRDQKTAQSVRTAGSLVMFSSLKLSNVIVRALQQPALIRELLEAALKQPLPAIRSITDGVKGKLPLPSRNALFAEIAKLDHELQDRLEQACERIDLLLDKYGRLAIAEQMNASHPEDAAILAPPTDFCSQALYLYLRQEFPQSACRENRFDRAEQRQEMLRQYQSEKYSSHYLGPKGVHPTLDEATQTELKLRLAALFPQMNLEEVLVESFSHGDASDPEVPAAVVTLSVMFNGTSVHYPKIVAGEAEEIEDYAISSVRYSWHTERGELSVYCEEETVRPELAKVFRDVMLGGHGDIQSMPIREFDLTGFGTPEMLTRFKKHRIDGVESIDIREIIIANPEIRETSIGGKKVFRRVENPLRIKRDRLEERNIYDMAWQAYQINDLSGYLVKQVRITLRMEKTKYRKAHDVTIQITAPNGFSDRKLTREDRELVFAQLVKLDCARQY